jgi:hypothetical protein
MWYPGRDVDKHAAARELLVFAATGSPGDHDDALFQEGAPGCGLAWRP